MAAGVRLICEVLCDSPAPAPGPGALHMVVLGVEAAGRMLVADVMTAGGGTGEIVASPSNLRQQVDVLLAQHPDVAHVRMFVPERLGISPEQLLKWVGA